MSRPVAILLTFAIVIGIPFGLTQLVCLFAPNAPPVIGVLFGGAFGAFAIDVYRALRDR